MDLIAAQDQGKPGRPARRRLDWTHIAREGAPHRQAGLGGKRASANDFRALTAKIDQRSQRPVASAPEPQSLEENLKAQAATASIAALAAFASPLPADEAEHSGVPIAELSTSRAETQTEISLPEASLEALSETELAQPSGEYADALSRDEMLALIKAAIEVESEQQRSPEGESDPHSAEEMLALIRAAVFAELEDAPVRAPNDAEAIISPELEPVPEKTHKEDEPQAALATPVFKIELKPAADEAQAFRFTIATGGDGPPAPVVEDLQAEKPAVVDEPPLVEEPLLLEHAVETDEQTRLEPSDEEPAADAEAAAEENATPAAGNLEFPEPEAVTIAAEEEEAGAERPAAVAAFAEDSPGEDGSLGETVVEAEATREAVAQTGTGELSETPDEVAPVVGSSSATPDANEMESLSGISGVSIELGSSFVDEFSTPYDEFSKPRPAPAAGDGDGRNDELAAANGKRTLARPAEYKFWEQDELNEESAKPPLAANGNEPGVEVYPAAAEVPSPPDEEAVEPARSAIATMELPSEQAGQVAQSLLDIMSLTNDSVQPQERALAADTLLHLIHRLPLKILVSTAERLSLTDTPSPRIITRLIRDPRIEVSGPLLEKCNSISDKDLINVIREGHPQSIRMIARRRTLSSALCDALIATREPSTVLTLVRNPGAELSHHAFFRLNQLAKELVTLQAPLATRADLPAPLAFELFWVLPAELRRYVMSRFLPDSMTLERILKITRSVGAEEGEGTVAQKFPPREKIEEFLNVLLEGRTDEATEQLAAIAGIHRGAAHRIIADRGGDPLAIALKALGVQRGRFEELTESLKTTAGSGYGADRNTGELQSLFDSLSFNKARVLLTYWDWAVSGTGPYAELAS